MEEIVNRIKGRLEDCSVILVGDRWKEAYKEDVTILVDQINLMQPEIVRLQMIAQQQAEVVKFLAGTLDQVANAADSAIQQVFNPQTPEELEDDSEQ